MRVVHVITRFIRGGADENTLLTCNGQAAMGHDVHLIAGDHHPSMVAALDPRVVFHHQLSLIRPVSPLADVRCLVELAVLLARLRPDVVHTHESKAGVIGRCAAALLRVPIIVHGVHILPFIGVSRGAATLFLALERICARFTHAFVDVSTGMRDLCVENRLGRDTNHFVVPSGMDTARFRNAEPLPRDTLIGRGPASREPVIGLVAGTLEPRKRIAELIQALARVEGGTDWILLVAGDGPQASKLRELVARLGMGDRVILLGHRSDLDRLIATADICLHAATNEGLPRVVLQYVLGGRPVVAAALPGIEQIVGHDVNGVIAPIGAPEALARAFIALAGDPERRRRFAQASRSVDLAAWDHQESTRAIERAYAWAASAKTSTMVPSIQ